MRNHPGLFQTAANIRSTERTPWAPEASRSCARRHSYVRRNAVLAINAMFKLPKGELLLPDAPELIEKVREASHLCVLSRRALLDSGACTALRAPLMLFLHRNSANKLDWPRLFTQLWPGQNNVYHGFPHALRPSIVHTIAFRRAQLKCGCMPWPSYGFMKHVSVRH